MALQQPQKNQSESQSSSPQKPASIPTDVSPATGNKAASSGFIEIQPSAPESAPSNRSPIPKPRPKSFITTPFSQLPVTGVPPQSSSPVDGMALQQSQENQFESQSSSPQKPASIPTDVSPATGNEAASSGFIGIQPLAPESAPSNRPPIVKPRPKSMAISFSQSPMGFAGFTPERSSSASENSYVVSADFPVTTSKSSLPVDSSPATTTDNSPTVTTLSLNANFGTQQSASQINSSRLTIPVIPSPGVPSASEKASDLPVTQSSQSASKGDPPSPKGSTPLSNRVITIFFSLSLLSEEGIVAPTDSNQDTPPSVSDRPIGQRLMLTKFERIRVNSEENPTVMLRINNTEWNTAMKSSSKKTPSLAVSFLGKTHSGKSTLISEILKAAGCSSSGLPGVAQDKSSDPTTANINYFRVPLDRHDAVFLDFEGYSYFLFLILVLIFIIFLFIFIILIIIIETQ